MKSQTSLVAQQTRLMEWADQIKDCQSRPIGMSIDDWCQVQGITRANYYYRLRRVRKACLLHAQNQNAQFVELPVLSSFSESKVPSTQETKPENLVAILRGPNNLSIEIYASATPELIQSLIGAFTYVK